MVLPAQTLLGANVKLAIGCAGETINIIAPGELVITPAANKSDKKDCLKLKVEDKCFCKIFEEKTLCLVMKKVYTFD